MTIGNRITTLRKEIQLYQEELADRIGVTRQAVSKWETDTIAPDAFNLIALADILNTSVEFIVTVKTENKNTPQEKPFVETVAQRSYLPTLGIILVIGGLIIGGIGIFLHRIWCVVGAFVLATGFILQLQKTRKPSLYSFLFWQY